MALTPEDIKMIGELLDKKFDERLQPIIDDISIIKKRLDKIEERLDKIEQRLSNLESHHGYENLDGVTLRIVRPEEEM